MTGSKYGLDPNRAVTSFFQDPTWGYKAVLGGCFNSAALFLLCVHQLCIPFSFCLWALSVGYILRVMRTRMVDGQAPLPEWNDWSDLFISGLTWIAVFCGQVMVVISVATIALLVGSGFDMLYALSERFVLWASSSIFAVSVAWLATAILSALLMANFAQKENTMAAFNLVAVFRHFRKEPLQFLQAWLIGTGFHAIAVIVPLVSVIGTFFVPFALFLAGNISATLLAQVWAATEDNPSAAPC